MKDRPLGITILVLGRTGSGKSTVAREIQRQLGAVFDLVAFEERGTAAQGATHAQKLATLKRRGLRVVIKTQQLSSLQQILKHKAGASAKEG